MALDHERSGAAATSRAAPEPARAEPSPLDTDEIPVVDLRPPPRPRVARTLALGVTGLALTALAFVSGLGLLFHYRPQVSTAHADVVDLVEASDFTFVRDLHVWSAHLLVVVAALHFLWVVQTAAYRPPRQTNYRLGLGLFALLLLLAATGYILPWDTRASWILTALQGSGIAAGDGLLLSAFALHCGVLPVLFGLLSALHWHRARRDAAPQDRAAAEDGASRHQEGDG